MKNLCEKKLIPGVYKSIIIKLMLHIFRRFFLPASHRHFIVFTFIIKRINYPPSAKATKQSGVLSAPAIKNERCTRSQRQKNDKQARKITAALARSPPSIIFLFPGACVLWIKNWSRQRRNNKDQHNKINNDAESEQTTKQNKTTQTYERHSQ